MKIKAEKPEIPELDMTPMIDCTFQLIAFFMLIINFENTRADERVKLPTSEQAKPQQVKIQDEVVINVGFIRDKNGEKRDPVPWVFYGNGEDVRIDQVAALLKREVTLWKFQHPKEEKVSTTVTIRADAEVPHGVVQELIKEAQVAGFEKFVLKAMEEVAP